MQRESTDITKTLGIIPITAQSPEWPNPANAYIFPDSKGFSMVDVGNGPNGDPGILYDGLEKHGMKLKDLHTVVLTHAHPDHMGGLPKILNEVEPKVLIHEIDAPLALKHEGLTNTFDIPLAKERAKSVLMKDWEKNQGFDLFEFFIAFGCPMSSIPYADTVREGEFIELGEYRFEIIHTPGHAPGHVSLFDNDRRVLLPGDLIGPSPAWYVPAAGGVMAYLDSLDKLADLPAELLLPAHGPVDSNPMEALNSIRSKLMRREEKVLDSLSKGGKSFAELLFDLFPGQYLHFFPGIGILESHLLKLEKDGVVERDEEGATRLH